MSEHGARGTHRPTPVRMGGGWEPGCACVRVQLTRPQHQLPSPVCGFTPSTHAQPPSAAPAATRSLASSRASTPAPSARPRARAAPTSSLPAAGAAMRGGWTRALRRCWIATAPQTRNALACLPERWLAEAPARRPVRAHLRPAHPANCAPPPPPMRAGAGAAAVPGRAGHQPQRQVGRYCGPGCDLALAACCKLALVACCELALAACCRRGGAGQAVVRHPNLVLVSARVRSRPPPLFPPPAPAGAAKEVLRENVSLPLLLPDLFANLACLRPLKVGRLGCVAGHWGLVLVSSCRQRHQRCLLA